MGGYGRNGTAAKTFFRLDPGTNQTNPNKSETTQKGGIMGLQFGRLSDKTICNYSEHARLILATYHNSHSQKYSHYGRLGDKSIQRSKIRIK